jgi:hypothetical protein
VTLTVGPKIHFPIANSVRGYVTGGAGWYRRRVEFTQPTVGLIRTPREIDVARRGHVRIEDHHRRR